MIIPVQPLLFRKMKTILLRLLVMLVPEEERKDTTGDMKEERMILELTSLNLRDSLMLIYA